MPHNGPTLSRQVNAMTREMKRLLLAAVMLAAAASIVVVRGIDFGIVWRGYLVGFSLFLFLPLVIVWVVRRSGARRRNGRIARGLCPSCAYDVRASRGRCPECGTTLPDRCSECGQTLRGRVEPRLTQAG